MLFRITEREGATILAALRRWLSYPAAREADSLATKTGKYKPLDNGEIEAVCKRLTKIKGKRDQVRLLQSTNGQGAGARVETSQPTAADRQRRTRRRREA